ncbi:vWA domain-containing protein [Clostridium tagluense]|uniref:VWFA domain-containing protein n=1 Tax=Clostridium tagluense TaxID=360422 RepID=A0A401UQ73_9CLOT|nr:VWA domain-containing protein [Clostridium tagluense]GCD11702.1 hypothetical protein Ctaglu_33250 [Clostridium tagluense]
MMGIFDMFKKKETKQETACNSIATSMDSNVGTSKIDLRKQTFKISLEKKSMQNTVARVSLIIDESYSMQDLYNDGTIQETIERLLPVAIKLDDNSELDVWTFNNHFKRMKPIKETDFKGYVDNVLMKDISWGGTSYAPVIKDIVKKYIKEEPSNIPTFVIFITDGENNDREQAKQAIIEASNHNIFWQFIGIGNESFRFLSELDTMQGRKVDNANFFKLKDMSKISDEKLYDMSMNEYPSWEKEAKKLGIIK